MAGMIITMKATGFNAVKDYLEGSIKRANNLTVPLERGAELMMTSITENFAMGGRPESWTPLASSTLRSKTGRAFHTRSGYKAMQILQSQPLTRTGKLKNSIKSKVRKSEFKLGTSLVYSRIHQKGGWAGRGLSSYIPKRPYLIFQDSDVEKINEFVTDYIKEGT